MKQKKFLATFVFALLLLFNFSAYADDTVGVGATSGTCGSNLTWSLSDTGVLTISGTGGMSSYSTSTGTPWETRKTSIVSVVVNSGVTSIGNCAFNSCSNLSTVSLPSGLKTIGTRAFSNCDALVSISLPAGVTSIGSYSFSDCDKLKNVDLPSSMTTIGENAFSNCSSLSNITLPENLNTIQNYAFYQSNLNSITLPGSLTQMGEAVFQYCSNLSSITWTGSLATVPACTFDCEYHTSNRLTEVSLPEGVTQISGGAFRGNCQLRAVYLPVSVENVLASAFANCSNLTDVYYAGTQVQAEAIQVGTNNTYLTSATWHYGSSEGETEEPDHSCGDHLSWSLSDSGILSISGTGAMTDYSGSDIPWSSKKMTISTVNVENGAISVGVKAFEACENLLVVNLPSTLTSVGTNAFNGCSNLTVVNYAGTSIQKASMSIGENNDPLTRADWYCSDDESQGIGATSGTCGSKLTWALSNDGTLTISGTGTMSNYTASSGSPWEARKSSIKTVVVGSGVTSVGDYAFNGCINLTAVNLSDGLKTIGNYVFNNCDSLVSITFPDTVTSIGSSCLRDCDKLRNVTLSNTLDSIGAYCFYNCDSLSSIELPDSITVIGPEAFETCNNLQTVKLSAGLTQISRECFYTCAIVELTVPEGIAVIGESAFSYNSTLSTLYLPSTLENVSSGAFSNCRNLSDVYYAGTQAEAEAVQIGTGNTYLSAATWHFTYTPPQIVTTLVLPNMLTTIESEAFSGIGAQMIVIPASVDEIESRAFADCPNLETLYFEGSPYSIAADILAGSKNVTVSVLQGSSAEKWAKRVGLSVIYH